MFKIQIFKSIWDCRIYAEEKNAKEFTKIYSQRKSPDSPGDFRYSRTGKINYPIISKNNVPKSKEDL